MMGVSMNSKQNKCDWRWATVGLMKFILHPILEEFNEGGKDLHAFIYS